MTGRIGGAARCPSCGSREAEQVDRKYFHTLLLCSGCGLLHRFPRETAGEMRDFYEEGYAEPGLTTEIPNDVELRKLIETGFRGSGKDFSHHIAILQALGVGEGSRMLDFGANWGYTTWQFRAAGFAADGYELSRSRAAEGRRLGIEIRTDLAQTSPPYDVVYSSHVLEHVPDPMATLKQQLDLVRDGGLVAGHTPNGSAAFRLGDRAFHSLWGQVHPVLLTDRFVAGMFAGHDYLVTSDDRPDEVGKWDQRSQVAGSCDKAGLFFAIRKRAAGAGSGV